MSTRHSLLITVCISLLALTWQLGVRGLNEPDEGRYASVAFEMLRSGDWIVPHYQGHPHLTKPPLIYWLTAVCFKLGGINEWCARATPAIAAFGTLLLTWSLARRWLGARHALFATLILLGSPLFFATARLCDPNMLLTLWVTLGTWAWLRWQEDGKSYQRWLYYLAHGLAFLTKGPVGCILILLVQVAFRFAPRPTGPIRAIFFWPGLALAATLGFSWYLLMIFQQPDRLDYFVRYELLDRVFTNVHKREEPLWFFWAILPVAVLPWLPVLASLRERGWKALRGSFPEGGLALHTLLILIFFSLSRSKLPTYILPALPPLALLIASHVLHDEKQGRTFRWSRRLVAVLALLLPTIMMFLGHAQAHTHHWLHGSTVLSAISMTWLLILMTRSPASRWLIPASGLILVAYASLLDVVRRHERSMFGESTRDLIADARRAAHRPLTPFYYTHAPAGLLFYLNDPSPPTALPLLKTNGKLTSDEYVRQLIGHLEQLHGQTAFVLANTHHLNQVTGSLARLPARALVQDRKYTLLQTP